MIELACLKDENYEFRKCDRRFCLKSFRLCYAALPRQLRVCSSHLAEIRNQTRKQLVALHPQTRVQISHDHNLGNIGLEADSTVAALS